ncbi:MAG: TAT-variant-translocated molybdopterin oxidoreductase [Chitinophagaceae bacterium]|nr:TAT-variant-translocated molybdopterin oxidoreductase [Chitinophagaceae bacterium]
MSEKKYWQGFGELNEPEKLQKQRQNEFQEELPFGDLEDKGLMDAKAPRRDFLKYLGFSTAAATIAASCKIPVIKAIPYANKPDNIIPGVAKYYATTYVQDGDVVPVVAKVRDGRPIKIEGNELCSFTKGGTSARSQASVLDLYDMYRNRYPSRKTAGGKFEEIPTFEQLDKMIGDALAGLGTAPVALLTSTLVSPSSQEIIDAFLKKFNGIHVQYDGVSYSGMLEANQATFGKKEIPQYNFDKANLIVSLGADFLATWLSPVEFAHQYAKGRRIDEKNPVMSKHYQFESYLSTTGSSADERFTHRPSETGAVALALYAALGGNASAPALADEKLKNGIAKVANDLKAASGKALVICGSNDVNVQMIVNAINNVIGAYGNTIDWSGSLNYRKGIDKDMRDLVDKMDGGQVGAVFIYGANPAYDYYDADRFKSALKKVKLSVSFGEKMDETTQLCNYVVPTHHYLESWGDAVPKTGCTSFIQPTIYPLFKTRPYQTSLMLWSGNASTYEDYFKDYWTKKFGTTEAYEKALQDGIIESAPAASSAGSFNSSSIANAVTAVSSVKKGGKNELMLYQKVSLGTGSQAGNPWLQELPDAVSKATWDNYAMISMSMAKDLGIKLDVNYEYFPEKPVIKLTAGKKEIELPVLVIPGMNSNTIAVAVGYGRTDKLGKAAAGIGKNAYPFSSLDGNNISYSVADVSVTDLHKTYKLARTQLHNTYENRFEVVRETSLATFKKDPEVIPEYREELAKEFYDQANGNYRSNATLYPEHAQPGLKWGMSIDMNVCIGCGACVVACNAENNIPVVGKHEVMRAHEMHWMRIDRYFVSTPNNPDELKSVVFQPMLCQHCDNAPCENVCPVSATSHSAEGLNMMAYNRCVGTRYCANNCPYKVRRFNWADYNGADSFPNNQNFTGVGELDPVVSQMNDDLTRMVLNPDVTVRSRGVMEKCSFCVQRLQAAKLDAKADNRPLRDGDAKTACMMACPTEAITFGNVHDKESQISKVREVNPQRMYYVIEQLHTLPNVNYLAKVRNTDEIIEAGHHESKKEAGATAVPSAHNS